MSKTVFSQGTVITTSYLNALNSIVFDGADADGHYPPIADVSLSQQAGSISNRVATYLSNLAPSIGLGLTLNIAAGSYLSPNGNVYASNNTQVTLPNNQTGYAYFNSGGSPVFAQVLPNGPYLAIAKVITDNGNITSLVDLRDRSIGIASGLLWPDFVSTAVQRTDYLAQNKQRVLIDSSLASFTVTLPSGPADGNVIQILDIGLSLATNPVTVLRNNHLVNGLANDLVLSQSGSALELVFVAATGDWRPTNSNTSSYSNREGLKNTVILTSDYTAKAFDRALCNSSSASFTVTLPSSPIDGAVVALCDVGDSLHLHPVQLEASTPDTVMGGSVPWQIDSQSVYLEAVYVAATLDWRFKEVKGVRSNSGSSVELTGDQIILGTKTFQGQILVPSPTLPASAVNKATLDAAIAIGSVAKDVALTNTAVKGSAYLASAFERILVDTSGAAFTITLPSAPSDGTVINIVDIGGQLANHPVTVSRNGKLINGQTSNLILSQSKAYIELIFLTSLNSWIQRLDSDGQTSNQRNRWAIITSNHFASVGDRLAIDTSSSPVVVTLPALPVLGDSLEILRLSDLGSNALTISKATNVTVEGSTLDLVLNSNAFARFLFLWNSNNWRLVQS